jgi:hypothetical protein
MRSNLPPHMLVIQARRSNEAQQAAAWLSSPVPAPPPPPPPQEIAKLRAARRLWARMVKEQFAPQNEASLILR